ncbi:unnamed protein product [Mycena citricolor]|uniref:Uncharacterized protein n=2 Tax=Mycena citricolor TaxID=2018698 RepID=A0AAD2K081_9AGAR|nr:unnamed protein product [Mycena citricolor]
MPPDEATLSTSLDTVRSIHTRFPPSPSRSRPPNRSRSPSPSLPPSPSLSAASGSSVSSFPSVASSFFFSSAAVSPGPAHAEEDETLIIPELVLPQPQPRVRVSASDVVARLFVVGDYRAVARSLNGPDGGVEDGGVDEGGSGGVHILRVRVGEDVEDDWSRTGGDGTRDSPGPAHVPMVEVYGVDSMHELDLVALEHRILAPFYVVSDILAPPVLSGDKSVLQDILAGPSVPLYTALIVTYPEGDLPAPIDPHVPLSYLIPSLSAHRPPNEDITGFIPATLRSLIPVVPLALPSPSPPSLQDSSAVQSPSVAHHLILEPEDSVLGDDPDGDVITRTTPQSSAVLALDPPRALLSPATLRSLRREAAGLFLAWWRRIGRQAEPSPAEVSPVRAIPPDDDALALSLTGSAHSGSAPLPSPAHMRRGTITRRRRVKLTRTPSSSPPTSPAHFVPKSFYPHADPLHLPSLFALARGVCGAWAAQEWSNLGVAVFAGLGFVAGLFVGVWAVSAGAATAARPGISPLR